MIIINIITVYDGKALLVENFLGIHELNEEKIRVKTKIGLVVIEGKNLEVSEIMPEGIVVSGIINAIQFDR